MRQCLGLTLLLQRDRLYTVDLKALNHILNRSMEYFKPEAVKFYLMQTLGGGMLFVEGEKHRQQRKVMNPAFGPSQIRDLTETFVAKALELRDVWLAAMSNGEKPARLDVMSGLGKTTLDVIGLAGFNYNFDSLKPNSKSSELNDAFQVIFGSASAKPSIWTMLTFFIAPLRLIPTWRSRQIAVAMGAMRRMGKQLLIDKKADIKQAAAAAGGKVDGKLEGLRSRDLLTLLIKANMATDIPEHQRLSDPDVLAQVPTFLVAGHETTSTVTAYCLFALSQAPEVQQRLREELWSVPTENPTMDELQELSYLDAVVRETMRVHAPVPVTVRVAVQDDVVPLSTPYADPQGNLHDTVHISKGTTIDIPITALNRSKALWGEDAFEFKPERWESLPETVQNIPGVWSNMMTFLGGPRACIGWRFSVIEMKALVFTLVRTFEFELAVSPDMIVKHSAIVQRPLIRGEESKGGQMPLLVRPHKRL